MSFLRTKILAAALTMLAMVAQPYLALAQTDWVPPDGPPLSNNTPAPVNVGPLGQTKDGELYIMKQGGNGFAVPFSNSFFGMNLPGVINSPATVNIYGNLLYRPENLAGANPSGGQVLITNDQGYARWADPATVITGGASLPDGNNLGDLMVWNEALQKWESTNLSLSDGEALVWDATTGQWTSSLITSNPCVTGCNLPVGNTGDTLRYNAGTWQANNIVTINGSSPAVVGVGNAANTGIVNLTTSPTVPNAHIQLSSPSIMLTPGSNPIQPGQILTTTTASGHIDWVDPITVLGSLLPSGTSGQTFVHNGTNWTATSKLTHSQTSVDIPNPYDLDFNPDGFLSTLSNDAFVLDVGKSHIGRPGQGFTNLYGQNVGLLGNNVDFTPMFGQSQTVTFGSDAVKIKGPSGSNNQINPGEGRFLYSKDVDGSVAWNPYLEYEDIVYDGDQHIDALKIMDSTDPDRTTGFANYGDYTFLSGRLEVDGLTFLNNNLTVNGLSDFNGDVNVTDLGDLFLPGIDMLPPMQMDTQGNPVSTSPADPICVTTGSRKVVLCEPAAPKPVPSVVSYTETFGPSTSTITFPRPNQVSGDVTVEACGAGGGGGGGGYGSFNGSSWVQGGEGGGGGGGGGQGDCDTATIDTSNGGELTLSIGQGGQGGQGSAYTYTNGIGSDLNPAGYGSNGAATVVLFQNTEILSLVGGLGGHPGLGSSSSGPGLQGCGQGDLDNDCIDDPSWDDGSSGRTVSSSFMNTYMLTGSMGGIGGQIALNNSSLSAVNEDFVGGPGGAGGHGAPYDGVDIGIPSPDEISGGNGGRGGFPMVVPPANPYQISSSNGATTMTFSTPVAYGKQGGTGSPSGGGGGGGGSSGRYLITNGNHGLYGGNGGSGGPGYVSITYNIEVEEPPTDQSYSTPGDYDFNSSVIPTDVSNVTFKVWGAGASGGGTGTSPLPFGIPWGEIWERDGGGGGAGAYVEYTLPRNVLAGNIDIHIGAGGLAPTGAINGNPGGSSTVSGTGLNITASGGLGGSKITTDSATCNPANAAGGSSGNGSSGGTITTGGTGGTCGLVQPVNSAGYRIGGQNNGNGGFGDGGNGGKCYLVGQSSSCTNNALVLPQAGQPGRVQISW